MYYNLIEKKRQRKFIKMRTIDLRSKVLRKNVHQGTENVVERGKKGKKSNLFLALSDAK